MRENLVVVPPNASIAEVLREAGCELDYECGGRGVCGRCRVDVAEADGSRRSVLACRTRAGSDPIVVDVSTLRKVPSKIFAPEEEDFERGGEPTEEERRGAFGLAVDLGTTTIVCALVSLVSRRALGVRSTRNPQIAFGRDVTSRIAAAASSRENADAMRRDAVEAIAESARALAKQVGASTARIADVVVSGNTTMEFLLTGRDAAPLGSAPFVVGAKTFREYRGAELGFTEFPTARARVMPVVSAFVGGDVLSGFAYLRRREGFPRNGTTLFLDLGTNGETILCVDGRFYASSTAAGPAFEGSEIAQGSLATLGAICSIDRDVREERWRAKTIGGGTERSICGSGLIDALAGALDFGALAPNGRLRRSDAPEIASAKFARRLRGKGRERRLIVSNLIDDEKGVYLTQNDVRQAQLALGAMKSGVRLTLAAAGVSSDSLDALYLAGGFGASLDLVNARRVGAIPSEPPLDKIDYCGNASLLGAIDVLTERAVWNELEAAADLPESVELAARPEFADVFAESLRFPESGETSENRTA